MPRFDLLLDRDQEMAAPGLRGFSDCGVMAAQ
jgi:hypothetical protein